MKKGSHHIDFGRYPKGIKKNQRIPYLLISNDDLVFKLINLKDAVDKGIMFIDGFCSMRKVRADSSSWSLNLGFILGCAT